MNVLPYVIDGERHIVSFDIHVVNANETFISPGAMAIGATGSVDLAEHVTYASAEEMKMIGINWVYSPVADVNSDPHNPVIGEALSYLRYTKQIDHNIHQAFAHLGTVS